MGFIPHQSGATPQGSASPDGLTRYQQRAWAGGFGAGFTPIKHTLHRNIQSSGMQDKVDGARVIGLFSAVVKDLLGEALADQVKGLYLKNRTLTVSVPSPVIGQELKLNEKKIVDALNLKMEATVVERLRFLA